MASSNLTDADLSNIDAKRRARESWSDDYRRATRCICTDDEAAYRECADPKTPTPSEICQGIRDLIETACHERTCTDDRASHNSLCLYLAWKAADDLASQLEGVPNRYAGQAR